MESAIDVQEQRYRRAERELWRSLGAQPTERFIELPRLGTQVRVQELGEGEPVLYLHGGPSAGRRRPGLLASRPPRSAPGGGRLRRMV